MKKELLICTDHQEYPTPLIQTMVFRGAELWCPYCGAKIGMFDSGSKVVKNTILLNTREKLYKIRYRKYLGALATKVCTTLCFRGKWMTPDELPQEEKDRIGKILEKGWKADRKIEDTSWA